MRCVKTKDVYVLSGRECLGNNEWGTTSEISVFGVYSELEEAKKLSKIRC